jgi:dihydropteroate synthase-like protein
VAKTTYLFVTGRLAEVSLREILATVSAKADFEWEIAVPGIQVAALMHTSLLRRRLVVPEHVGAVIVPGWCQGDLAELEMHFGKPFRRGPRDLNDLPEYFGVGKRRTVDLSRYAIEIIAEINHATRLPLEEVLIQARALKRAGADLIDVGGVPGESSPRIGEIVSALRNEGLRVSIDSFDEQEVVQAVEAGAELILSCNHSNVDWVSSLGVEVVAIPDAPQDLSSLDRLVERLDRDGCRFRLDPILEPIGVGFTASLERYMEVRRRYPECAMMMGVGNVTELTEVDSAGVNMVLAAVCEDLGIQSILTTQVINWCRTSVAEFDAARRLVHYAVGARTIPKHVNSALVMLRDSRLRALSDAALRTLAESLRDPNYRIYAERGELHLMNGEGYWHGDNPFGLFEAALQRAKERRPASEITAEHAFYLGYELARAEVALLAGKQYVQDEPMNFGLLGAVQASSSLHPNME